MSKQAKNGRCSCWDQVNKSLEETGDELTKWFSFSGHHYLEIATSKIVKSRKKPKRVFASFCPMCGAKLKEPKGRK